MGPSLGLLLTQHFRSNVELENGFSVIRKGKVISEIARAILQQKYAELFLFFFFRPFYPKYLKFSRKLYANDHEKTEKAQEQV